LKRSDPVEQGGNRFDAFKINIQLIMHPRKLLGSWQLAKRNKSFLLDGCHFNKARLLQGADERIFNFVMCTEQLRIYELLIFHDCTF
jgi:hypothetical protein